ncbi:MAG TPA: GspH/FimT family pseudopilin [Thermoanaerobaculia bacterium]|jgi:type IV fimbrial biogenesis protein FimT
MVQSASLLRSRGFSLLELLVVLAILALMTAVGIPWFMKLSQRQALKAAAREIETTLAAARMTAVKRNAPVSVVILSLTPPISFQTIEPAPPAPTPTIPPRSVVLNANAVRFFATPAATGGTITFGGDGRLATPPPLPTPAIRMIVEGPANGTVRNQIQIDTTRGGAVRIITPVDWQ